jgi:glycosyltransferase involved in cell wall biosynthesis
MKKIFISIVIPVFNEEKRIENNIHTILNILRNHKINHEFILVDDGSIDRTWQKIQNLSNAIPNIHAIRFSRNFGKESALCAGLDIVQGDACIVMDVDLQHPPEIIPDMVKLWNENGYEVVEGVKTSRGKERIVNRLGASLFYKLLKRLSGFDLTNASDYKLLDAKVITAWRMINERNTFFRALSLWVGFKRISVPFDVAEREGDVSKWSFIKLIKLALAAITFFSSIPLQIVTFLGMLFLIGALVLGADTLYMKIRGYAASGFTTVIILQLIIGSVIMISLGIIGTYIARIFDEVKNRPRYIITENLRSKNDITI